MPTYDYVCTNCGHVMEVIHGVYGQGPSSCPLCGGPMRKAFVPPTIHFKGSGWARKDRGQATSTRAAAKAAAGGSTGSLGAASSSGSAAGDAGAGDAGASDAGASDAGDRGTKDAGSGAAAGAD